MSASTLDPIGEEKVTGDVPARSRYAIVSLAPGIASSPEHMTPGDLRYLSEQRSVAMQKRVHKKFTIAI